MERESQWLESDKVNIFQTIINLLHLVKLPVKIYENNQALRYKQIFTPVTVFMSIPF